MSLEGIKINNKSILISELGNNIFSNNFNYNTSFQIDYTLPLTIKLKNVSYDDGSRFYIQFREGNEPVAYVNNEGRVTSSLLWLTDIPIGTTKEIKDIDLTLCYEVCRVGKKIDNFVVSSSAPAPTFGQLEITIYQPGEFDKLNTDVEKIEDIVYTTEDITYTYSSVIKNAAVKEIYNGDIKNENAWETRIYYFPEDTMILLKAGTESAIASLYKSIPDIDVPCVRFLLYQNLLYNKVIIPGNSYVAANYIGIGQNECRIYKIIPKENNENKEEYNDVIYNKKYLSMIIYMMKNKCVDRTNRLTIGFNGDSIFGSQLEEISKSDEYYTGEFPPNMSKNIIARKFYDRYKFTGEDTQFRNLIHSDWIKSGFNVSQNKDDKTKGFNEIEIYGCSSPNDYAEITITGYKFFKLIWSYWNYSNTWTATVTVSVNGSDYVSPSSIGLTIADTIIKPEHKITNLIYQITQLDVSKNYKIRITAGNNYDKIGIWGCEFWNNPRLDVVMQALSGTTAYQNKNWMPDAYYQEANDMFSKPHKPVLVITNILCTNDSSYISQYVNGENIHWYLESQSYLYNLLKNNGVYILAFAPHIASANVPERALCQGARSIALNYNTALVDIPTKLYLVPPEESITGADGTHLSNYGNEYYFEELKRLFD